jgi:hypothetical protein
MFDVESRTLQRLMHAAVFTTAAGSLLDLTAELVS